MLHSYKIDDTEMSEMNRNDEGKSVIFMQTRLCPMLRLTDWGYSQFHTNIYFDMWQGTYS